MTRLKQGYPLLGNYDHWHWSIEPGEIEQFARWDMFTVNFETAYYAKHYANTALKEIKNLNPKTKILAWISLGLWNPNGSGGHLETQFLGGSEDWWIHKRGTASLSSRRLHLISWWPGAVTPNPKSGFAEHVVRFLQEQVLSTELYDGVFYDCVWDDGWLSQALATADISASEYREGITSILRSTRDNLGPNGIIMANGAWSDNCPYWKYANGTYQENALGDVFGADWNNMWRIYQRNMIKKSPPERLHWIGVDTQYKRKRDDYSKVTQNDLTSEDLRRMRLGLGTALLLDNGYFGFDRGDGWHGYGEQWWFPEYDADLGFPRENHERETDGTLRRRYDHGLVIVNPGSNRTVDLDASYRDATTNEIVNRITVPREDARILIET